MSYGSQKSCDNMESNELLKVKTRTLLRKLKREQGRLLTKPEELLLAKAYKASFFIDEIKVAFLEANTGLVRSIVNKFNSHGVETGDMMASGLEGVLWALEKFNPDLGYKFSTYATPWIHQRIRRCLENESMLIRLPSHMVETIGIVKRNQLALAEKLNGEPSASQIAEATGLTEAKVTSALSAMKVQPASVNQTVSANNGLTLGDTLLNQSQYPEYEGLSEYLKEQVINSMLDALTPSQRQAMIEFYGLNGEAPKTVREISKSRKTTTASVHLQLQLAYKTIISMGYQREDLEY